MSSSVFLFYLQRLPGVLFHVARLFTLPPAGVLSTPPAPWVGKGQNAKGSFLCPVLDSGLFLSVNPPTLLLLLLLRSWKKGAQSVREEEISRLEITGPFFRSCQGKGVFYIKMGFKVQKKNKKE